METTATMQPVTALEATPTLATEEDVRTKEFMLDYLDNAVVGLHWVDGEGAIIWANKADYEPLGYSEDEYLGHNITEFHADAAVINDILERLLDGQSLYNYRARLLRKDGTIQKVLIASSGLFDGAKNFLHTRCFTINDPG